MLVVSSDYCLHNIIQVRVTLPVVAMQRFRVTLQRVIACLVCVKPFTKAIDNVLFNDLLV